MYNLVEAMHNTDKKKENGRTVVAHLLLYFIPINKYSKLRPLRVYLISHAKITLIYCDFVETTSIAFENHSDKSIVMLNICINFEKKLRIVKENRATISDKLIMETTVAR